MTDVYQYTIQAVNVLYFCVWVIWKVNLIVWSALSHAKMHLVKHAAW